jgi:ABC-type antimicrobial peptide transport system permease subunit
MFAELSQDVRFAARMFRRNPGFLSMAILSLALGIGVSASILTLFQPLTVRPLQRSGATPAAVVAAGLFLLLACANVGNLLLARAASRRREVMMRAALGASRARLVQQLLTESLLLAMLGGAAGLLLAFWLTPVLSPVIVGTGLDVTAAPSAAVFGYTLVVSLLTGIIFGLAPALDASKVAVTSALDVGERAGRSHSRLHRLLVVTQIAVSLVVLIGAGQLNRSVRAAGSGTGLSGALSLLALALAAAAIYRVTAYVVSERTRDIGIRMALGAETVHVMKLVSRQGLLVISGGIAIGLAAWFALARISNGVLFGVTVTGPLTFLAVAVFLTIVGWLACYAPARRATKIESHSAMRND